MSYEYEDELERMKRRRQEKRKQGASSGQGAASGSGRRHRDEGDYLSSRQEEFENRKIRHSRAMKKKRRRKRIFLAVEVLALIILASVIFSVIKKQTDDGYWTIAVFGVDSRDGNLGKGSLSDVEMLCNIDKKTGEIKIVSVFRDTYLKIGSDEYHKINEAYCGDLRSGICLYQFIYHRNCKFYRRRFLSAEKPWNEPSGRRPGCGVCQTEADGY